MTYSAQKNIIAIVGEHKYLLNTNMALTDTKSNS